MKRTGSTNEHLQELILDLRRQSHKENAAIWSRIAMDLEKPTRQRRIVNMSRLNRFTKAGECVIVPGKVLGAGVLNHALVVAAFAFSESAKQQIEGTKGKCLTIQEMAKQNPSGKNVRIIG